MNVNLGMDFIGELDEAKLAPSPPPSEGQSQTTARERALLRSNLLDARLLGFEWPSPVRTSGSRPRLHPLWLLVAVLHLLV